MLRRVVINRRTVPVPVPIRTLADALDWIAVTLVPPGHSITRVTLDAIDLEEETIVGSTMLTDVSRLELRVDSPCDLSIQSLEAAGNLATIITRTLKETAVGLWQLSSSTLAPSSLESVRDDLALILDLVDHVRSLVVIAKDTAHALDNIQQQLQNSSVGISMAASSADWKGCARLLLNRLEPQLKQLMDTVGVTQAEILSLSLYAEGRGAERAG